MVKRIHKSKIKQNNSLKSDLSKLTMSQINELEVISEGPCIYINKIYLGIDGDAFKLTFCEENLDTRTVKFRGSYFLTEANMAALLHIIQQVSQRRKDMGKELPTFDTEYIKED